MARWVKMDSNETVESPGYFCACPMFGVIRCVRSGVGDSGGSQLYLEQLYGDRERDRGERLSKSERSSLRDFYQLLARSEQGRCGIELGRGRGGELKLHELPAE